MATGPINYSALQTDPFEGLQQYVALGQQIRAGLAAREQKRQQEQLQQEYQRDTEAAMANPTPEAFSALSVKYPQHRESFKQAWSQLNEGQQQSQIRDAATLAAALHSDRPDVALAQIDDRIQAMTNSGQDTRTLAFLRQQIEADPKTAYGTTLRVLSGLPGGDKVLENLGKIGTEQRAAEQAPADLAKKQADAAKAGIDAKYAEQGAVLDLQKKGWDIRQIQEDIGFKREANRIAAMNAAAAREGNALKREELGLKIQEARSALDDKIRAKVADTESAATSIDNSLNTIERIKGNKSLDSVLGSMEGQPYYPNATLGTLNPFGNGDERADAIALIDTLGSQAFLSQAANLKGMGALSNAEGEKLQAALTNLSRTQSEKQFRANLDEAARLLKKGRETLSKRTGVPLAAPDTPAAPGSRPPLSSFNKSSGGATGEY